MKRSGLIFMAALAAAAFLFSAGCGDDHDHGHTHEDSEDQHIHGDEESPAGHDHSHEEEPAHQHGDQQPESDPGHIHETPGGSDSHSHEHEPVGTVHIDQEDIERFGIETAPAGGGVLKLEREIQGELTVNADRTAHIVPRVAGIVTDVRNRLGDRVAEGRVLAVIESSGLADMKAAYLAAVERYDIAAAAYRREKALRDDGISSESEYLEAKRAFAEAKIERRSSRQKLLALGLDEAYLSRLLSEPESEFTVFEIRAPFGGVLISRHITAGEAVGADTNIFTITDLDTIWADLQAFQSDAGFLEEGQELEISSRNGMNAVRGKISMINSVIESDSRTLLVRVILDNSARKLHPGTFVTALVRVDSSFSQVVLARDIIQEIDSEPAVFVRSADGFEARRVVIGRSNGEYAEILEGVEPGDMVAAENSFMLKAELKKSEDGGHAGHGHSH